MSEDNGANGQAVAAVVIRPITREIRIQMKRQVWTAHPRGLYEIQAGLTVEPDPLYSTAENMDRVHRQLRSSLETYMAEALSPDAPARAS